MQAAGTGLQELTDQLHAIQGGHCGYLRTCGKPQGASGPLLVQRTLQHESCSTFAAFQTSAVIFDVTLNRIKLADASRCYRPSSPMLLTGDGGS